MGKRHARATACLAGRGAADCESIGRPAKNTDKVILTFYDTAYVARAGNAGGVHNLTIEPGDQDIAGLLKKMHTGLLVTELIGFGINGVTGDYSRGAAGRRGCAREYSKRLDPD